jgi:predicted nucleic acid-binding protein
MFVLDASVTLGWCFGDEEHAYAERVLRRLAKESAVVPAIWLFEVANGLVVAERRGRLTAGDVARVRAALAALPIEWEAPSVDKTLGEVLELARTHALSAYDAAYLELAMRRGCPLATADLALRAAAAEVGVGLVDVG